jgi:hypothetical protein
LIRPALCRTRHLSSAVFFAGIIKRAVNLFAWHTIKNMRHLRKVKFISQLKARLMQCFSSKIFIFLFINLTGKNHEFLLSSLGMNGALKTV